MLRCGFFVLSFALLAIGSSVLLPASSASAWVGELPTCQEVPDYREALESDPKYDPEKTAYIVLKRDHTGGVFGNNHGIYINWDYTNDTDPGSSIRIIANENSYSLSVRANSSDTEGFRILSSGEFGQRDSGSNFSLGDLNCVQIAKNVRYVDNVSGLSFSPGDDMTDWPHQVFDTGDPANGIDENVRCSWHDVGCWFSKVGDTIVDSFASLFEGIVGIFEGLIEFLGSIFIPSDQNIFVKGFGQLSNYMTHKLGFLLYPVDFLNSVIRPVFELTDSLNKNEWHCYKGQNPKPAHCSGVCANNVLGDQRVCLRIGALEENFPALWATVAWFVRITIVVGMIELLRRKYMQIVSN